jgi:hypothetical protein
MDSVREFVRAAPPAEVDGLLVSTPRRFTAADWALPGVSGQEVPFFGMHYVIPVVIEWPGTVIAVNVGGAVMPGLLSQGEALFLTKVIVPLLLSAASS